MGRRESTASARPRTSSPRSHGFRAGRFRLYAPGGPGGAGVRGLGAVWAGGSKGMATSETGCGDHLRAGGRARSAGSKAVGKGGIVVCGGIHMSDIPSFPYAICGRNAPSARWRISRGRMARSSSLCAACSRAYRSSNCPLEEANETLARLRRARFRVQLC